MAHDEYLDAVFKRYQGIPLFNGCKVDSVKALAVDGESLLHKAVMMKDIPSIETLLRHSADPNFVGSMGFTPLHLAAFNDNLPIAEILVMNGANVGAKNEYGETPADLAKEHRSQILYQYLSKK